MAQVVMIGKTQQRVAASNLRRRHPVYPKLGLAIECLALQVEKAPPQYSTDISQREYSFLQRGEGMSVRVGA